MAVPANFACPDREKFQYCFSKLVNFKYSEDQTSKTDLNVLLDQLNSLEYSTVVVSAKVSLENHLECSFTQLLLLGITRVCV